MQLIIRRLNPQIEPMALFYKVKYNLVIKLVNIVLLKNNLYRRRMFVTVIWNHLFSCVMFVVKHTEIEK